jgi:hypothetical protein
LSYSIVYFAHLSYSINSIPEAFILSTSRESRGLTVLETFSTLSYYYSRYVFKVESDYAVYSGVSVSGVSKPGG